MPEPPRVIVNNAAQRWALIAHLKHFVDLLLILDDSDAHRSVLQHVDHLLRDGILVERYRYRPQGLCCHHAHVELRAILADDRHMIARLDAQRGQAAGEFLYPLKDLLPG